MNDLQKLSAASIAKSAEAARERITAAEADVERLDADAATAEQRFESDPSPESHADRAVKAQLAKNASAKLVDLREELAPVLAEADRRRQIDRLAELRRNHDWPATVRATTERMDRIVSEFRAAMQAEFSALTRSLAEFNAHADERTALERVHGNSEPFREISFQSALLQVVEPIQAKHYDRATGQPSVRIAGSDSVVTANVQIPINRS